MAWGLVIALVVSLAAGGGTIYAADQAAPGDALYSLDRLAERVQVNLTQDPAQAIQLQLDLATERIQEMQKLAARGDTELVGDTLADYGAAVETALNKWQSAPDQAALGEAIELQLKLQDQELAKVGDDVDPDDTTEPEAVQIRDRDRINWCGEESELHPVAEAIAAEYDMPYEDVIGWFCSGAGMGEIELALRIGVATDSELETLFSLREEGMGWGQIMQDLDLIGGPAQQGPPDTAGPRDDDQTGAPDHAGPKEDQESGPPDQAGPRSDEAVGPKENLETGPPDNAGPKEESPSNQPDTVGPPDDLETGPPDNAGPKDEAPGQSETQPGNGNGRDNNDK